MILGLILLSSFKPSKFDVRCNGIEGNGVIQFVMENNHLGPNYNTELAKRDAVYAALYVGADGCGKVNPLLNNSETIKEFKKIEKRFFRKKGQWSKYTRQSTTPNKVGRVGQHVIAVDLPLLRRDLENLKIIKSLTDGL